MKNIAKSNELGFKLFLNPPYSPDLAIAIFLVLKYPENGWYNPAIAETETYFRNFRRLPLMATMFNNSITEIGKN